MKQIFISSTFRDMNVERDIVDMIVRPRINEYAEQYDETISFVDLRWGVDTSTLQEEDSARKVLSVCLDEIDACKPYMIIFMGDRYGWIPDESLIKSFAESKNLILEDYKRSVTALEIEYGALSSSEQLENCLFYFRNPLPKEKIDEAKKSIYLEFGEQRERLERLKQRILNDKRTHVSFYDAKWDEENQRISDLGNLPECIVNDLEKLMWRDLTESVNTVYQEKELSLALRKVKEETLHFGGREDILCQIQKQITNKKFIAIGGKSESGKTAILCKIADSCCNLKYEIVPVFAGNNRSILFDDILSQIVYHVESICNQDHMPLEKGKDIEKQYVERFNALVEFIVKPVVILIDSYEKIAYSENALKFSWLPQRRNNNLHFVITYSEELFHIPGILPYYPESQSVLVSDLTLSDKRQIAIAQASYFHKSLPEKVIARICSFDEITEPLFFCILVCRLVMMNCDDFEEMNQYGNGMEGIEGYMLHCIASIPRNQSGALSFLLKESANRLDTQLYDQIVPILCLANVGYTVHEMKEIAKLFGTPFQPTLFSNFKRYLSDFFIQDYDGHYQIENPIMRKELLRDIDTNRYLPILYQYVKSLNRESATYHNEIMHLAVLQKDYETAYCYITDNSSKSTYLETKEHSSRVKKNIITYLIQNEEFLMELLQYVKDNSKQDDKWRFTKMLFVLYSMGFLNGSGVSKSASLIRILTVLHEITTSLEENYKDEISSEERNQLLHFDKMILRQRAEQYLEQSEYQKAYNDLYECVRMRKESDGNELEDLGVLLTLLNICGHYDDMDSEEIFTECERLIGDNTSQLGENRMKDSYAQLYYKKLRWFYQDEIEDPSILAQCAMYGEKAYQYCIDINQMNPQKYAYELIIICSLMTSIYQKVDNKERSNYFKEQKRTFSGEIDEKIDHESEENQILSRAKNITTLKEKMEACEYEDARSIADDISSFVVSYLAKRNPENEQDDKVYDLAISILLYSTECYIIYAKQFFPAKDQYGRFEELLEILMNEYTSTMRKQSEGSLYQMRGMISRLWMYRLEYLELGDMTFEIKRECINSRKTTYALMLQNAYYSQKGDDYVSAFRLALDVCHMYYDYEMTEECLVAIKELLSHSEQMYLTDQGFRLLSLTWYLRLCCIADTGDQFEMEQGISEFYDMLELSEERDYSLDADVEEVIGDVLGEIRKRMDSIE